MPRFIIKRLQMSVAFYKMYLIFSFLADTTQSTLMVRQGDKRI